MNKKFLFLLLSVTCIFLSCKTEEPAVASYQMEVDNEFANDTIDHNVSYTFEVKNSLTSATEIGTWEVQLLKQDSSYFTIVKEENSQEFKIQSGSLIEKIPTDQLFQYDGLRIKGRIFFNGNDGRIVVEKVFSVWGKPTISLFRIKLIEDNGYPNEKNITLEFKCGGVTNFIILHENEYYENVNYMLDPKSNTKMFKDLDMTTSHTFCIYASNFLGTTISDPIYIGED